MNKPGFIVLAAVMLSTCQAVKTGSPQNYQRTGLNPMEIPALQAGDTLIIHTGFALLYSEAHKQAKWVAYELTLEETLKGVERSNRFTPDPKVITGTASDEDYRGSGYDRGHLAPAADMSWSEQAMNESFYYSNISPQLPAFNRGIWKRLEDQVRKWAQQDSSVYIVTGPVLSDSLPHIGPNRIAVPAYFYKVLLVWKKYNQKAIAFIIQNKKSSLPLNQFAVSIDSLEHLTSIDFFPALPDSLENTLERFVCLPCWKLDK
jgi:endonuclease G